MNKCAELAEKFIKEAQYGPVLMDMGTAEKPDLEAIISNIQQMFTFINKILEENKKNQMPPNT